MAIYICHSGSLLQGQLTASRHREGRRRRRRGEQGKREKRASLPFDRAVDWRKQTLKDRWVSPQSALLVSGGVVH